MELSPPDPRIGQVLQGRYRILARVAAGAMGVVYRGERVELARPVAVKFLHPWIAAQQAFRTRFETEARAMSRLGHPNCVSVIDFGVEGSPYVVMDFIAGMTLRQMLERGRLSPPRAIAIARQLLAGVAHAHAQGIIHRDLKPENFILADAAGLADHVRILDFGLAKLRDGPAMTSGLAIGTPSYMSPEQTGAPGEIDGRTDIYALGVVLFEMLGGRKPFVSDKVAEILLMHRDTAPPSLRKLVPEADISRELEAVVNRALAKMPDVRFQTATEFAKALDQVPEASVARAAGNFPSMSGVGVVSPATATALVARAGSPIGDGDQTIAEPAPDQRPMTHLGPPPEPAARHSDTKSFAFGLSGARWLGFGAVALAALMLVVIGLWRRPSSVPPSPTVAANPASEGRAAGSPARPATTRAAPGEKISATVGLREPAAGTAVLAVPAAAPVVPAPAAPASAADRLASARELVAAGEWEQALVVLQKARRENPQNAEVVYEAANVALEHKRWPEGAQAARVAADRDGRYKDDQRLVTNLIRSLASDRGYEKSEDVLHGFGAGAVPFLKEAAAHDKNPVVRQRAAELLGTRAGARGMSRPPPSRKPASSSKSFFSR